MSLLNSSTGTFYFYQNQNFIVMKKNYKVYLAAAIMLLLNLTAGLYGQQVITQWTFEGDLITPSTGQGTASLTGGTTATFATGNPGRAWNTTTYPAQGTIPGWLVSSF